MKSKFTQLASDVLDGSAREARGLGHTYIGTEHLLLSLLSAGGSAASGILLLGNESQTVGPQDAPMAVHLALLSREVVLLEGIRLADVDEGVYLLNAAPINLSDTDGAPCRALLIKE